VDIRAPLLVESDPEVADVVEKSGENLFVAVGQPVLFAARAGLPAEVRGSELRGAGLQADDVNAVEVEPFADRVGSSPFGAQFLVPDDPGFFREGSDLDAQFLEAGSRRGL